jgi:hypothetical protein
VVAAPGAGMNKLIRASRRELVLDGRGYSESDVWQCGSINARLDRATVPQRRGADVADRLAQSARG